jgi:putative transposase
MIGRMEVMTMPPVVTPDQRQGREFAKREIVRYVEHGMTVTQAQRCCPVSMHRTTVYRFLKRMKREGEHAFVERRHGHPVKLRGEVLTCVLDYCQNHASAASREVQRLVAEHFGLSVSISQREPRARRPRAEPKGPATRKKSRKRASPLPLDLMNRLAACCCWQQRPKLDS